MFAQVVQADEHTVCLRLRTSAAVSLPASPASEWDDRTDEPLDQPGDPFIDPFTDTQHDRLPWPWMRSPPGSDRGALTCALNACLLLVVIPSETPR